MLLRIENLHTHFETSAGVVRAVDGVSLEIAPGETVALVGESGCGKSLTALSILRLVPPPGRIVRGRIWLDGRDLLAVSESEMRKVRGGRIAMIFQEPMTSLNPLLTIGEQIDEASRLHGGSSRDAARRRTIELLQRVGISAPQQRSRDYPHQLSGGMRQRAMIAMALAGEPELLIADEPTTALDVTIQAQILARLLEIQQRSRLALLFITHDLTVVAQIADVVGVMYAGRIVEQAPAQQLLARPQHPYTRALLRCAPRLVPGRPGEPLPVIPGEVPGASQRPPGCAFHPRCELGRADAECTSREPPLQTTGDGRACACWKVSPLM